MNDNKDEVMNYSYIFAKDIFEYNHRKGKMEYFDANLVYNTIYDRHLLLTDNFPHTMIKTIDDALKSKDPRELDKLEAWIDSSLDFNKLTDDELNYLFNKVGFYYNELLHYTIQEKANVFREYIKIMYLIGNEYHKAKNPKTKELYELYNKKELGE